MVKDSEKAGKGLFFVQFKRKKREKKNITLRKLRQAIRQKLENIMFRKTFLVLMLPFIYVFATDQTPDNTLKMNGSIMNVVMNQKDSVAGLEGNRLYLKAQNIFHSKNGYVLRNEGSVIVLPRLSFDEKGEGYLICRSPEDFQLVCSNCGFVFWFSDTWDGHCPVCRCIGN